VLSYRLQLGRENTKRRPQGMFAYIDNMEDPEELRALTAWKVHTLTGDRKGTF